MNKMDTFQILQTIFLGFGLVVTVVTALLVWRIGVTQNSINQQALAINDFAEIFLMPQTIFPTKTDGSEKPIGWNVLVKNASAYPIYLNAYTLNGMKHDTGGSSIPNNPDSWYAIQIPVDVQVKNEFYIIVDFDDYRGKRYQAEGFGSFNGSGWNIKSQKRIEIN